MNLLKVRRSVAIFGLSHPVLTSTCVQSPPPCIHAFISLLHVTRVWALVCRLDNPALRTSSSELVKNVAPVLQRMWGNLWRHNDELFVRVPYSDLAVSVIMELAEKSHEIITRLSESVRPYPLVNHG